MVSERRFIDQIHDNDLHSTRLEAFTFDKSCSGSRPLCSAHFTAPHSCLQCLQQPWSPLPPTGNIQQAFQILLQMPRHYCCSCRAPLHTTDGLGECVSCLGECHAKTALTESPCSHSKNMSLASLRSQIAFFIRGKDEPVRLLLSSLWQ